MSCRVQRLGFRSLAVLLALGLSAVLPACDWFKASNDVRRASPFLSGLSITPASVRCEQPFVVGFRYDDPQDDISLLLVTLQLTGSQTVRLDQVLWNNASPNLDLAVAGRAGYTHIFPCGTPGGSWQLTVQVEDRTGHTSNALIGAVTLVSSGGG